MNRNSLRTTIMLKMIEDGWFVKDGVLYTPENEIYKYVLNSTGYNVICKHYGEIKSNVGIHCIVGYQKFGDKIFDTENIKIHIRHLDGNPTNNLDSNIEIGSQSDNMMDRPKEVRLRCAINASYVNRRFTDDEVKMIKQDRDAGFTYRELCVKYKTSKSTLSFLFNHAQYAV